MLLFEKLRRSLRNLIVGDPLKKHIGRGLKVGENFAIMEDVVLDFSHTFHIEIGNNVTLAPRVHILAHDASTKMHLGYTRIGKVTIGNRVFIGASSIILPGITIGNDVIIGAGSVVSADVDDGCVVAGNPAKLICKTEDYIARKRRELEISPCFGVEFTREAGVSQHQIEVMNKKMKNRIGYID